MFSCFSFICQVIPQKRFYDNIAKNGIALLCATMGMTSFSDSPAEDSGLRGVGEVRLVPDLSTKNIIPW